MVDGTVTDDREAVIPLEIRGAGDSVANVQASVDTGYNGFLTLPRSVIEKLALPFAGTGQAALGDGRDVEMDLYVALVLWGDGTRSVGRWSSRRKVGRSLAWRCWTVVA